jgi:hypothetical protein
MPLQIDLDSDDRQLTKTINVQTYPRAVTGSYQLVDWNHYQSNWPHLSQCNFVTPAKDGFADLLIGVDNPDLHFSIVDIQGPSGGPVARLGPLGWTCIGSAAKDTNHHSRSHLARTLHTKTTDPENHRTKSVSLISFSKNTKAIKCVFTPLIS